MSPETGGLLLTIALWLVVLLVVAYVVRGIVMRARLRAVAANPPSGEFFEAAELARRQALDDQRRDNQVQNSAQPLPKMPSGMV